jgi:23S rRNA (pseudouridine1915-N3)-methyltransferase
VIEIVCVGRARGPLAQAAADYEQRLGKLCTLRVRELREEPLQLRSPSEVLARERARIEPALGGAYVVALDRRGRELGSEELAGLVREREELPPQRTAFVLGGPLGLDPALLEAADLRLSLGRPTLPHQLARVVLTEQLYRAFTIVRRLPYHH